jgi:predicted DNA-binding protein (MmcQ/YjbR family)
MRLDQLKAFALSLPGTSVVKQWGETLVFKVGGKMFVIVSLDGELAEQISFKCGPKEFKRLTDEVDGAIPAPYLARASWIALEDPAALSSTELKQHIQESYDLVCSKLPKKIRSSLTGTRAG